jgi:hypothetical protein
MNKPSVPPGFEDDLSSSKNAVVRVAAVVLDCARR